MAKFLKFKPRNLDTLKQEGHFRTRSIAECGECNKIFSSRDEFTLAADLDLHGWSYYQGKDYDYEGPLCPNCKKAYAQ